IQIAGCAAGCRFSKFSQTGCGIGAIRNTLGHIEFDAGTAVRAVFRPGAALEWTYADFLFIGLLNQRFHTCDSTIPEMNRYRAASFASEEKVVESQEQFSGNLNALAVRCNDQIWLRVLARQSGRHGCPQNMLFNVFLMAETKLWPGSPLVCRFLCSTARFAF